MKVRMINYTNNAKEMLAISKRTRHLVGEEAWDEVVAMSDEELDKEIEYVFGTIGSSWEFVSYTFLIADVTRAFTHQLVRHRVGVAFAQQAQRVGVQEDFGYMMPEAFDAQLRIQYGNIMEGIQSGYDHLIDSGVRQQDARGVLPTNIHTNILFKANLRALSDMFTVRLCLRAQGEFQNVAKLMKEEVLKVHPWAEPILQVNCIRYGVCKFPRFEQCPVSEKHFWLRWGVPSEEEKGKALVEETWKKHSGKDLQPDPKKDYKKGK